MPPPHANKVGAETSAALEQGGGQSGNTVAAGISAIECTAVRPKTRQRLFHSRTTSCGQRSHRSAKGGEERLRCGERSSRRASGAGEAALALAQARLVRGETDEALPTLERLAARGDELGANAGRVLGRYFVRVKKDGPKGAEVFAGLARQYRAGPEGEEFVMWAAQAYLVAGQRDKALALMDELVSAATLTADSATEGIRDAEYSRAWFLVRYDTDTAAAAKSIATVLTLSPGYAPALYLDAELAVRGGDLARAKASIQAAIAAAPGKALYVNFARRHGLSDPAKAP
jgi:tetratricopeptide (TPR) repeat protein